MNDGRSLNSRIDFFFLYLLSVLNSDRLKDIPRERFSTISEPALKLFKVSGEEAAKAKKMEEELQPKKVIPPPQASPMDTKLGFDHKAIEAMPYA